MTLPKIFYSMNKILHVIIIYYDKSNQEVPQINHSGIILNTEHLQALLCGGHFKDASTNREHLLGHRELRSTYRKIINKQCLILSSINCEHFVQCVCVMS
jgi:hypothetical protein